jgi:hypothetical protein
MNDTYRYRSLFLSAEYQLTEEGVAVTERRLSRFARTLVPYDQIPVHSTTVTLASKALLWVMIGSGVLFAFVTVGRFSGLDQEPAAPFIWGALCLIAFGFHTATRTTSEVFLFEHSSLAFHRRRSNESGLTAFLGSMQKRKLEFLESRLARRAPEIPSEEAARYLLYLRESGLVDENGYTRLRTFLASGSTSGSIGFK